MHARDTVRRLFFRADEHHAQVHQPVQHIGGVVHQNATQRQVVPGCQCAGMFFHVFEVCVGAVLDARFALMRRPRRRDGSDRPGGGPPSHRIFFKQDHVATQFRRLKRCRQAGATATNH